MRQSEGNKTAKRLSAICVVHPRSPEPRLKDISPAREAIEGLATAALAWLARILSPLLLKTASVLPARNPSGGPLCDCLLTCSIAANGSLGNVTIRSRHRTRHLLDRFPRPLFHRHEKRTIVAPEAFGTAHRLQKKERQQIALGERTAPRAEADLAAAIVTVKFKVFLEPNLVRGVLYHVTPQNHETTKGRQPIVTILPSSASQANTKVLGRSSGAASHL
jgi:hypothetical protein